MSFTQRKAPPFLIKTYQMLENNDFGAIICWNEEENGFIIRDVQHFSSNILPIYFKHKNMHSYIRQLNMYGFSKKRGADCNYYHHPCFLRRQPELISHIQRRVENKTPRASKLSTVSIQDQIPSQTHLPLLRMNQLLLLQQFANLQLILNEIQDDSLADSYSTAMRKYLECQKALLHKHSGMNQKQMATAGTLQELHPPQEPSQDS